MKIKTSLVAITLFLWGSYSYSMEMKKNESKKSEYQPSRLTLKLAVIDNFARTLASYVLSEKPFPCTYPQSKTSLNFLLPTTSLSANDSRDTKLKNINQIFEKLDTVCPEIIVHDSALMLFFRVLFDKTNNSNEFGSLKHFYLDNLFFDLKSTWHLKLPKEHQKLVALACSHIMLEGKLDVSVQIDTLLKENQGIISTSFLEKAIRLENNKAIPVLLFLNADVTLKTSRSIDLLTLAIEKTGNPNTLELLCSSIVPEKYLLSNPLATALNPGFNSDLRLFTILLEYPFPFYNTDTPEKSPLHLALTWPFLGPLEQIVRKLKERNQYDALPYHLKLHIACALGDYELIKSLPNNEVDRYTEEFINNTLLHTAITFEQVDIVHTLLNKRASVNHINQVHQTPLKRAIHYGSYKIVELLLQKGALPSGTAFDELTCSTPLIVAQRAFLYSPNESKKDDRLAIIALLENQILECKLKQLQ